MIEAGTKFIPTGNPKCEIESTRGFLRFRLLDVEAKEIRIPIRAMEMLPKWQFEAFTQVVNDGIREHGLVAEFSHGDHDCAYVIHLRKGDSRDPADGNPHAREA